jgi:hypothetical protein
MKLATVHAGDAVAITAAGEPRLGEVRTKQRGHLIVAPWPDRRTNDRGLITVAARDILAHYRRRARASAAEIGDLVLVDLRGRRFHARVTARAEQGELGLDPLKSAHQLLPRAAP